jgi:hypothetical protein
MRMRFSSGQSLASSRQIFVCAPFTVASADGASWVVVEDGASIAAQPYMHGRRAPTFGNSVQSLDAARRRSNLHLPMIRPALSLAFVLCLFSLSSLQGAPPFGPDAHTVFLLEPDLAKGALVDRTGHVTPTVRGGETIADERFGACWKLGGAGEPGLTIQDNGVFHFEEGVTIDAWLRLEERAPDRDAWFALKIGSFAWDLGKGKLNTAWLNLPTEPIFTTTPQQYKYYPVGGEVINGLNDVPVGQWVRLTVSYDPALGVVTTLIDGVVDRRRYRYRGAQPLQSEAKSPLTLLRGLKNCRLAALKLSTGRPEVTPPSMEAYLNALPYLGRVMITLDHVDPQLAPPVEVTITWEKPNGPASTLQRLTLDSSARRDLVFDAPTWLNSWHTYTVSATAAGRQFFSRTLRLANVKPAGRTLIYEDRTLSRDGKKFFPLMTYHALPEDFPLVAELGFNTVYNHFNVNRDRPPDGYTAALTESLNAAEKNHLFMVATANAPYGKLFTIAPAKDHPALLLRYGAAEPWGDLTRMHESYNAIKLLDPDLPVMIVQNNYSRLQETAPGADIVATDPYPVPNVSLRGVVDATQAALRATGGKKPAWTVVPQYGAKIPTREELRCMVWLAISSGATGLAVYSWEDRVRDPQTRELKGWYVREHPEQIEDLRAVLHEVRARESILIGQDAAAQPAMTPANPALHVLLKDADGRRYLIAANDARREAETVLKLEGTPDGDARPLDGGAAALAFRQGQAALKLPPLGVAVYEMAP